MDFQAFHIVLVNVKILLLLSFLSPGYRELPGGVRFLRDTRIYSSVSLCVLATLHIQHFIISVAVLGGHRGESNLQLSASLSFPSFFLIFMSSMFGGTVILSFFIFRTISLYLPLSSISYIIKLLTKQFCPRQTIL